MWSTASSGATSPAASTSRARFASARSRSASASVPTPVREALRRLEAEGLVTLRKNQIVVNALSEPELREAFAIRAELESFAVRVGTPAIQQDEKLLAVLESLIDAMDRYEHRPEEWRGANEEFHRRIYHQAGMPRLESMIEALWVTVEPYLRLYVSTAGSFRTSQEQHRALLTALRGRGRRGGHRRAARAPRRHRGDRRPRHRLGRSLTDRVGRT